MIMINLWQRFFAGQGGQTMKKHTIEQRMISLMSALFLCIFLFAGDNNRETDSELGAVSKQKTIVCDVYTIAQGVCSQELLQSDAAKLVRSDTPRKSDRHRWFEHFIKGSFFLFIAAVVLYLVLFQIFRQIQFRRRYIIKYIHDQDGYKNRPSLYCISR